MDAITIDTTGEGERFEHRFNRVIGSGHLDLVPVENETIAYQGLDEEFYANLSV